MANLDESDPRSKRVPKDEEEGGGPVKSFLEHLEDLRWVIIKGGAAVVIATVICLVGARQIFEVLKWPLIKADLIQLDEGGFSASPTNPASPNNADNPAAGTPGAGTPGQRRQHDLNLELLSPLGGFVTSLKLAFYAGLVLGLPFILYFVGQFVIPALKRKEKKYFLTAFTIGTGFFLVGVIVCYFVFLPFSLQAIVQYNKYIGFDTEVWRAEDYFEFVVKFLLGVGLLFEVPVLILTLVKVELISHEALVRSRRYMFAVNFAVCAVITPADLATTFLLAFGLQICFEICVLISRFWERQRRAAEASLAPPRRNPVSPADG